VSPKEIEITPETNPDHIEFDFINEEIRDNFLQAAPVTDSLEIIEAISKHFAKRLGKTLIEFNALLRKPQQANNENIEIQPFALLTAKVLKRLGGDYIQFAEQMEQEWGNSSVLLIPLSDFNFEVVTVDPRGEESERETKTAQYYTENLGNNVILQMVAIPGGKFLMGSPETEAERSDSESPQHEVTVPPFFMGKYPVTQAQWKFVASLPQVNDKLISDPSKFKGENCPVEFVSWFNAVEFCDRLTQHTGKNYRLPSEAEWEYACRAGTTTPFHFGETITSEFANYNAEYIYGAQVKGTNRRKRTEVEVGHFGVANAFGLYDMHGNVWEWCADLWHENYEGAPTDGSAWIDVNENDNQPKRLLRGGSWDDVPVVCRSAYRNNYKPYIINIKGSVGFRVVCGVFSSRTLSSP
jgi:formylglycine-generating enzyme required for sulfatase activity